MNDSNFYIIKQLDTKEPMPPRYRGIDPRGIKPYSCLYYRMKDVIPFDKSTVSNLVNLVYKMRKNGESGKYPENLNKDIYVLTVDVDHNVLKEDTFDNWYKIDYAIISEK